MTERKALMASYGPILEALYERYNGPAFLTPDPVEVLYPYGETAEREIVAFIAASLAYGRAGLIKKSLSRVLPLLGPSPRSFLLAADRPSLTERFRGFRHRFTDEEDLVDLLFALGALIRDRGSLERAFADGLSPQGRSHLALVPFVGLIRSRTGGRPNSLLADPSGGSACKRLHLFLKWMVRCDAVDPGGWTVLRPASLVVPLDTHMHRIGLELGLTARRQADLKAALEMTEAFALVCPDDPARYDFVLARFGIRSDLAMESLFDLCRGGGQDLSSVFSLTRS